MKATTDPTASPKILGFRPMQAPSLPFLIALLAVVGVAVIVVAAWAALIMIAFAFAAALLTLPIVNALERRGVRRSVGAVLAVTGLLVGFLVVVLLSANILINQGAVFVASLPQTMDSLRIQYESLTFPAWLRSNLDLAIGSVSQTIEKVDVSQVVFGFVEGVLGVAGIIGAASVVPFFMYYVLVDEPQTRSRFYRALPTPWRVHVDKVVEIFLHDFADYFRAEFIVGGIVGIAVAVGMFLIGSFVGGPLAQFALLLGIFAALLELLPSIGPVISYFPALLLAATTSPLAVVLVSIYYFVIFNIEGSFLVPTVEGKIIDFDRATVLVLVAVGFGIAGIAGGVLALPVAAIVRDVFAYAFQTAQAESAVVAQS